ncbi:hypothetical protein D3C87_1420390 [compost metagenome]
MGARIQQRAAQALVGRAAHEQAGRGLDVAAVAVHFGAHVQAGREVLGNGPGHEIDDAAHVLRAIAHRARTSHHVNGFQVAQRHGGQRQLRLAVRRVRHRHAVHQDGGPRREARRQAADANVERHVAAAGAVAVLHLDAGNLPQHVTYAAGSALHNALPLHDRASAGMGKHLFLGRSAKPVARHGNRGQLPCLGGRRRRRLGMGRSGQTGERRGDCHGKLALRRKRVLNSGVSHCYCSPSAHPGHATIGGHARWRLGGVSQ